MHDRCVDAIRFSAVRVGVAVLALTAAWLALGASGCKKDADKAGAGGDSEGRSSTTLTYPPSLSAESSPSQVAEALIRALDARDKQTLLGLVAAGAEAQQIDAIFRKYGRPANTSLVDAAGMAASGWLARSYSTVTVILFEATGGSCGMWAWSAMSSCSVCVPGGSSTKVSVCPLPK